MSPFGIATAACANGCSMYKRWYDGLLQTFVENRVRLCKRLYKRLYTTNVGIVTVSNFLEEWCQL